MQAKQMLRRFRPIWVVAAVAFAAGCAKLKVPMPAEWYVKAPGKRQTNLIVFLRGVGGSHHDFKEYGLVDAVWERGLDYDMVAPDSHLGYLRARVIDERLKLDIIEPARAMGYRRIWLVGASMGGQAALWYDWNCPGEVEGVVMMSPFLTWGAMIREVNNAGGLHKWEPGRIKEGDWPRMVWTWLKNRAEHLENDPRLWLAYGQDDPFRTGHVVLADRLPADRVVCLPGGHDYDTFRRLWDALLDRVPFEKISAK